MRKMAFGTIGLLALAGLIGFLVRLPSGPGSGGGTFPGSVARPAAGAAAAPVPGPSPAGNTRQALVAAGDQGATVVSGGGGVARNTALQPTVTAGAGSAIQASELVGPRVIKTAQLSLVVRRRAFDDAFARATEVAARYPGGYVEVSSTEGVRSKFGRLTIRVPAVSFQAALSDLRRVGRVEGQSISGQDVTSQYVDLQARLRNWQAQERVLLRLMSRATTIGDTLRIQNELSQVQMRVEELKGQLRVLDNQTSFATIDVSMRESGASPIPPRPHRASGLVQAWRDARDGFVSVLSAVVVGLGYLLPIGALLALVWLGIRRLRPRVVA
jgi:hypothetical protein